MLSQIKPINLNLVGRDSDLDYLLDIIYKKRLSNILLIGDAGVGKTALIKQLAYQLRGVLDIYTFSFANILENTTYRGEFETKFNDMIKSLRDLNSERRVALFIDEFHMAMSCGDSGNRGGVNLVNLLKPIMSDCEFPIIACTTEKEYRDFVSSDDAIVRRFSVVRLSEISDEDKVIVLQNFVDGFNILNAYLQHIVSITKNLDSALDLLDLVISHSTRHSISPTINLINSLNERRISYEAS